MVGVAFPPLASITPLILSANVWNKGSIGLLSALVAAWGSVVGGLAVSEAGLRPILKYVVASFAIIAVVFGIDRAFTNRIHLHEFEMNWAVGSSDRLQAGPDSLKGEEKVIIYRRQGENTCYDTIYQGRRILISEKPENEVIVPACNEAFTANTELSFIVFE
jgi:hypothetical protein